MTITAILAGRRDTLGRLTVKLRINQGQKRNYKTTGIKVEPSQFRDGQVVNHPKAAVHNKYIRAMIVAVESGVQVKEVRFKDFAQQALREWDKIKTPSTIRQYVGELNRFVAFAGDLKLSKVTPQVINEYKTYLLRERTSNTVWKVFKFLKTIFHKAVKEKVIQSNPFDLVESVKYRNPKKQFLTREQLDLIDTYVQRADTPERIKFIGNWFLIGCWTGLRYSDMHKFTKSMTAGGRLLLHTTKTHEPVSLPVSERLQGLFKRVNYQGLDLTNEKYNEYLKVLARACDLPPINAHMSRHSFAVMCADAHISPEVTARLMGITNLKVVSVYYKLSGRRIDEEYGKL